MPNAVVANGPIRLTDAQGRALSIPLSLLSFDANGAIKADTWPLYPANKALVDAWLPALVRAGLLAPDAQSRPAQAMLVTAQEAGAVGNTIAIAISNVRPDPATAGATIFDATVTETNTHAGLAPATVKEVLGAAAGAGARPGLVFVASAGTPELPKAGSYELTGGSGTANAGVDIDKATGTGAAFGVKAKKKGAEGDRTVVTIAAVDAAAATFTLVATWTKAATGIKAGDMQATFDYEIAVAPPAGGALATPAPGTYALSGGTDTRAASPAAAALIAAQ